ncbi:tetratricopeptide repeat protein [Crossiella sp. SN42]|uniref:sialidase family protein n=1 Tax=Crossiella sp. SN42 TaxID=2944808 RepID=UPI00207C9274|nr:exo-alpha-sialidase [Crossiella sp. SN42]MCO1576029.1 tetratricopeptide repeat protein [Crossiella sp. SN42]
MNVTGFARGVVAPVVAVAVLASGLGAPKAVAAEPGLPPEQLSNALFNAAVQLKDAGRVYDRNLILTAELVDWRAKNPAATADVLDRHAAKVEKVVAAAVAPATERDLVPDVFGRGVEALYTVPEVDKEGPQLKVLLTVLTARDLKATNAPEELRGVLHQFSVTSSDIAPRIWTALREAVKRDGTLNGTWKARLGTATVPEAAPVDPAAPIDTMKQLPQIKKVIDVDAIQAAFKLGTKQGLEALNKQIKPLIKVLGDPNSPNTPLGQAMEWVKKHVDPVTGELVRPSDEEQKQFEERMKQFDSVLDGVKGGLMAVATVAKILNSRYAKDVVKFAEALYAIGKNVVPMIAAVTALGTIAAGAAIGSVIPAIGTVIGAVVGLVVTLVGLLGGGGGGPSPELQAIQAMHKEMRESFTQLKEFLVQFQQNVNARFDQIDAALNKIYSEMLDKFNQVLVAIERSNFELTQEISTLHSALLGLATNVQSNHQQTMAALQDGAAKEFKDFVGKYLDYAAREGHPIPSYDNRLGDNYLEAAQAFSSAGNGLARSKVFMRAGDDVPSDSVLETNSSASAVNYLTRYATARFGAQYGQNYPAAGTPNADLFAAAARAYALLMQQNQPLAAKEKLVELNGKLTVARVEDLLKAGEDVVAAARRFNQPRSRPVTGPWTATNTLFTGLQEENGNRIAEFANSLTQLENDSSVNPTVRPYNLWGDRNQPVVGEMKVDAGPVPHCYQPAEDKVVRHMPAFIKSEHLPAPVRMLKQLNPNMRMWTCWTHVSSVRDWTEKKPRPPITIPCKYHPDPPPGCHKTTTVQTHKLAEVRVSFAVMADIPGRGDNEVALMSGGGELEVCNYPGAIPSDDEPWTGCGLSPADLAKKVGQVEAYQAAGTMHRPNPHYVDEVVDRQLHERRTAYYGLVANRLNQEKLDSAKNIDTNVRVLRAFTEVGFPTALQSDARLRELLYGTRAIPSSLNRSKLLGEASPLAVLYTKAALNLSANKDALHEQSVFSKAELRDCTGAPAGVTSQDPVARCLATVAGARRAALGERIEYYAADLTQNPAAQDPQTVTALMRALRIETKATHPDYPIEGPVDPGPTPPGDMGRSVGELGGSGRATLRGKHFLAWQGKQNEVLIASSADGKQWSPPATVSGTHTASDAPAIVAFQDKLLAFWRSGPFSWADGNNDRTIAMSASTDGKTWSAPARLVPVTVGSQGISVAVQNNKVQVMFRGTGTDGTKYVTYSHDGKNWKRPQPTVNNGGTSTAPGLTALGDKLVQLWRGYDADPAMWFATSANGVRWSDQRALAGSAADGAPSLAVHNGKAFAVWRNAANDGLSVSDTADGGGWAAPRALHAAAHAVGVPSLGVAGGKLAAIWRDAADNHRVNVSTSADGITWSAPEPISRISTETRHQQAEALLAAAAAHWSRSEREQAVVKAKEALAIAREIVPESPGYAATLARWIQAPVSGYLADTGRHDEAISLLDEAIAVYQKLGEREPQNPEHQLREADVTVAQGTRIWNKGDREKGRDKALAGVNLARTLVAKGSGYATVFGQWIRTPVSGYLADTGRHDEAISLLGEAIAAYRKLAQQEPQQLQHQLNEADSLVWQGIRTWNKGDRPAALTRVVDGIGVARQLAARDPAHADRLGEWLLSPGADYAVGNGKKPEAIAMAKEAVEIYTRLAQADPRYQAKLTNAKQKLTALQG